MADRKYFFSDIFFTAIETGLYWAELVTYEPNEEVAYIRAYDETKIHKVTPELLKDAFAILKKDTYKGHIPSSLKDRYLRQFETGDADFDATASSNLLQIALYNEIIF